MTNFPGIQSAVGPSAELSVVPGEPLNIEVTPEGEEEILTAKLQEAMTDESQAPMDYLELKKCLKNQKHKEVIDAIIADERRHSEDLQNIYSELFSGGKIGY